MEAAGLPYDPPQTYVKVDPVRAKRVADAYEAMEHDPSNPEVKAAYQAMINETLSQYQAMLDDGMVIEFIPKGTDPYKGNPRNMTEDVRTNKHMWVFSTDDGFGSDAHFDPADNPLLGETKYQISGRVARANDIFRAVHDYFGHVKEGVGFRADGEENAWRSHSAMYSPEARRAMTSETRGQNSWVNYGPFGETNRTAKSEDTHYADQKIGLLPQWAIEEGAHDRPQFLPSEDTGRAGPGDTVLALRVGSEGGSIGGKNAGNVAGVADHMVRQSDSEAPAAKGGQGNTIGVYRVKFTSDLGKYQRINANSPAEGETVGRKVGNRQIITYSFPEEGKGYTSEKLGQVSTKAVYDKLKEMGFDSPDDAGGRNTENAIRAVIADNIKPVVEAPKSKAPTLSDAERMDLTRMADSGDIEGIKASPILAKMTQEMKSITPTDQAEGFASEAWRQTRVFHDSKGEPIKGVDAAIDYLTDNARNLAAEETNQPHFETAKDRRAVIVIGPPAAGKSTIANQIALKMRAAIPDADEAKKIMPEYAGGIGASATHEESSLLSTVVLDGLMHDGDNMVIPKVGGSAKSVETLRATLKAAGYDVHLVLMDVAPKEAFRRMIGRYLSSGRLIPPHYFDEVVTAPAKAFEDLRKDGKFDGTARVRSDRGAAPIVSEGQILPAGFHEGSEVSALSRERDRGPGDGSPVASQPEAPAKTGGLSRPVVDASPPRPDPVPDGLAAAEASVGKDETIKQIADEHGIGLTDGAYDEKPEVDQLRKQGRISPGDEAALQEADTLYAQAEAFGNTIKAAAACML